MASNPGSKASRVEMCATLEYGYVRSNIRRDFEVEVVKRARIVTLCSLKIELYVLKRLRWKDMKPVNFFVVLRITI